MKAKILCVYEEGSMVNTPLIGAEGLSMLIDADDERTLFDTGGRGRYLIHNLGHLDIPAGSISRVVISHGHAHHIGGLDSLLTEREAPVTVISNQECLSMMEKRRTVTVINAPKAVKERTEGWMQLSEHLFALELPAAETRGVLGREIIHETALVLMTRGGPVLITGCAHTGIINAIEAVKRVTGKDVHAVVGGVHLVRKKNKELDGIAHYLMHDIKTPLLYMNHCATPKSKTQLRTKLGLKGVKEFYVGNELVFDI